MIYLYGAGGHAKVILETLKAQSFADIRIIDNRKEGTLLGLPIHKHLVIEELIADDSIIFAIGDNEARKLIAEKYPFIKSAQATHPSANISPSATLGEGTVVMAGVSIQADTRIGKHSIINTNSCVDHDNVIGDFVHISPNAALAGGVEVGEGTHLGIGACIIQGIRIGSWATIGAGAVVINDIPDHAVVVGNPGRIIKYKK
jgi:sugar O-acyltransferase (sialic acid O-acetyltransferase NeuD family)